MIKKVIVTNYLGESIEFELRAPEKTGLYVQSITGLGPGKANINTTNLATDDGSIYNSARSEERNIVMTLGFLLVPGITDTIEDARQLTYKYFPKKKSINFYILTDRRELETTGYVESNEPDIFSQEETTAISIICPDPNFYSAGENGTNVTTFNGIDYEFEFPFENNTVGEDVTFIPGVANGRQQIVSSLPDEGETAVSYFLPNSSKDHFFDEYIYCNRKWRKVSSKYYYQPDIEFGSIENLKERNIFYDGEVETGVIISMHAVGAARNIVIYNTGTRESMSLDTDKIETLTGAAIVSGDDITISTIKGHKYVTLLRNGKEYNILNAVGKLADWFQLAKGDNIFTYTAEFGSANLQFKIINPIAFEGV